MKKVLVALAISCSTFMLSNVVIAAPHFNDESRMDSRHGHDKKKAREFREEDQQDNRRMREERGVKRLIVAMAIKLNIKTIACLDLTASSNGTKSIMTIFWWILKTTALSGLWVTSS
jgi:hypothetical protein